MFDGFYKGKRVLVTGHTGFKGSWLSLWLLRLGAEVCGYALPPRTQKDNFVLSGLSGRLDHREGDIRSRENLKDVFSSFRPDVVFHLAAQALVKVSYENPAETFETNLMGSVNVLDAVINSESCQSAVMITSDKCYENREIDRGYREDDELGGFDPYSASKGCAEIAISAYRRSFADKGKCIASARAGNVIGGGDWSPDRLVPDCVRCFEKEGAIALRKPGATRPWQHVLEPVSGYLKLASVMASDPAVYCDAWNFGPDTSETHCVSDVVEMMIDMWGSGGWEKTGNEDVHEATLLALDITKAREQLSWRPRWGARKAVEKTVEWYRNYSSSDVYTLCMDQIEEYESTEQRS